MSDQEIMIETRGRLNLRGFSRSTSLLPPSSFLLPPLPHPPTQKSSVNLRSLKLSVHCLLIGDFVRRLVKRVAFQHALRTLFPPSCRYRFWLVLPVTVCCQNT